MFTHSLSPEDEANLVSGIRRLLERQERGVGVHSPMPHTPDEFALIMVTAVIHEGIWPRTHGVDREMARSVVTGSLETATRRQQKAAQRTIAAIIRKEIKAGRLFVVRDPAPPLVEGGANVSEFRLCTDNQYREFHS